MRDSFRFLRAIIRDRRTVGAIAPSGRHLAACVIRSLGTIEPGSIIVELGPGTGIFTRAICKRHPRCHVVAIEIDRYLAGTLTSALPQATIVNGCATNIRQHLQQRGLDPERVAGIVSGLPLLVLPNDLPTRILHEVTETLPEGARFVQFTYSRLAWRRFTPQRLRFLRAQLVMTNIPPASVLVFSKAEYAPPDAGRLRRVKKPRPTGRRLFGVFPRRPRGTLP